ncbi:hypothetical protein [Pseudorhodoplanes sp.]
MDWGALVEQAITVGLTQFFLVAFVAGVVVGVAIVTIRRRTRR